MGKFCKKCGKLMKNITATHCSDECLLSDIKNSKSLDESKGVPNHGMKKQILGNNLCIKYNLNL